MNFILILLVFIFVWFCQLFVLKLKTDVGKKSVSTDNDLRDLNDNKIDSKQLTPLQEKVVFRVKSIFFWLAIIATFLCGFYVGNN